METSLEFRVSIDTRVKKGMKTAGLINERVQGGERV